MEYKFFSILILAGFVFSLKAVALANDNLLDAYPGISWNTSLKKFKTIRRSLSSDSAKRTEARAIDFLMMDFHEVDKSDESRPAKFLVEKVSGENADYVFYDNRYCLVAIPVALENVEKVQKEIVSSCEKGSSVVYPAYWEYEGDLGWLMMEFDYQEYVEKDKTRIYFVKAASYYRGDDGDDASVTRVTGPKREMGNYLIFVSDDYFKNSDNAWTDYQTNEKGGAVRKEEKQSRASKSFSSVE